MSHQYFITNIQNLCIDSVFDVLRIRCFAYSMFCVFYVLLWHQEFNVDFVVYSFVCTSCQGAYIGSTKRNFHVRYHEHYKATLKIHKEKCGGDCNFIPYILEKIGCCDENTLRLKEARHINNLKPILNNKDEFINFRLF